MMNRQKVAKKVRELPPSGIRKFFDLVVNTEGVISLGVGEPDFVTPWHIREASIYSIEKGDTTYTSNYGLLELRELLTEHVKANFNVSYNPNTEALITVGVSEAVDIALRAILDPGDEVLIPEPCFVSYKPCTILAGGTPVVIETTVETEFKVTPEMIQEHVTDKTKALILSYPNNPTGSTFTKEELISIAEIARQHNLIVISDEIYGDLTFDGKHTSFASISGMRDNTILINGFSKSHAMTGWRIGYVLACEEILSAMLKIHQYSIMCAPVTGQMAALEALKNGAQDVRKMCTEYDQRRRLIVSKLNSIGLTCHEPKGAFYAFPSVKATGLSAEEFAEKLLLEEKVAVVPGGAFGKGGEDHLRCAYAASTDNIIEAMNRMERFINRL